MLFTDAKGVEKPAIRKRVLAGLEKLQQPLRKLLRPDEEVLWISRAQAPASFFEHMTLGWYVQRVTATVLVLTSRRLLHFACDLSGKWKHSTRAVAWGELASAKAAGGLFRSTFELRLQNGSRIKYWGLGRADAKKLQAIVPALLAQAAGQGAGTQEMPHLCPACFASLTSGVYRCHHCGQEFRDESTMVRRSLLIPGGGYFYCRQTWLGIADFVTEAVLTVWLVALLLAGEQVGLAVFVAVLLAMEKALTIHHCRKFIREFIPAGNLTASTGMGAGVAAGI
jgi:hypothetical protein